MNCECYTSHKAPLDIIGLLLSKHAKDGAVKKIALCLSTSPLLLLLQRPVVAVTPRPRWMKSPNQPYMCCCCISQATLVTSKHCTKPQGCLDMG